MMNRQIRVEKIIGTVKCVVTSIEIQAVKTWNSSAFSNKFSYLFGRCRRWRRVILSSSINKTA